MKPTFARYFFLLAFFFSACLYGQVYHIEISGTIDNGLPHYIQRVVDDAEAAKARAVVLEINTFGGRVDAATTIKDILLSTDLQTIAFVNRRAISAGAFIALSCRKIGMARGSTMGAATVVDGGGTKAPEKAQSYMRSEIGATAEENGRNRKIAEAMVDEDVEIDSLTTKGKLVTLTAEDAVKWEMADFIAPSLNALMDSLELGDEKIVYTEVNWAENIVRFLTGPVISGFLLTLGLIGVFFEVKSPGWGVPGTAGLICLGLYFGSHFVIDLASWVEIILFIVGLALLVIEIFVIPGVGIAGVSGVLLMIAAIFMSQLGNFELVTSEDINAVVLWFTIVLAAVVAAASLLIKFGPETSLWKRIGLADEQRREDGYTVNTDYAAYLGKHGVATTPLRPAGKAEFGADNMDVVSEGGFIDSGSKVKVVRVEGIRLVVRQEKG